MIPTQGVAIEALTHPEYLDNLTDWIKWRDTYQGGRHFVKKYLRQFSLREDYQDFADRLGITYCPRFAGAAIDEVKNSIYQRMADITRVGGSVKYQEAVEGKNRGVDLRGNSMNSFIGQKVLSELLLMGRVGVFVDMPVLQGPSKADSMTARPYLYIYNVEDIRNWVYDEKNENQFEMILLRDYIFTYDEATHFPIGTTTRYRRMWKEDGKVLCQIYDENETKENPVFVLDIPKIPFVVFEVSDSLMKDIADYQIALMNLASSDIAYTLKANFPFYTEQFDPKSEGSPYIRTNTEPEYDDDGNLVPTTPQAEADKATENNVKVGTSSGRRYPINTDRPAFINPSSEPLKASMAKQEQLKEEIRLLLNLGLSSLKSVGMASAESKKEDNRSLESGLSNIGLTLEKGEREIAELWAVFEGEKSPPTVKYPVNYSLRTDEERRREAQDLEKLAKTLPSSTYQREIGKSIARIMLGHYVAQTTMATIDKEIDAAPNAVSDPDIVAKDVENGLVSPETASKLRGYPEGEAKKAEEAHAARLARIADAQSTGDQNSDPAARGLKDMSGVPQKGSKPEKAQSRDTTQDDVVRDKTRGKGKSLNKGNQ